jgi:predicted outer membrane protein
MRKLVVLGLALLTGLAACGRDAEPQDTVAADTLGVAESPEQTQALVAPIRVVSLALISYGDMGMQRSAREEMRRFGQTVATDHRGLVGYLDSAAGERGATLAETGPARELESAVRMAHAGLENLQEADFDLAFIRAQVESHRQLLDKIDHELIPATTSTSMETLLQDTRAMVYAHLMRARQLLGDMLGEPVEPPPPGTEPQVVPRTPPPPPDTVPPPTVPPGTGGGGAG